jgi:hypothetical protein
VADHDDEVFNPGGNVFELVPGTTTLPGSFAAAVALASGAVLITGGYGNGSGPRASAWLYTPR